MLFRIQFNLVLVLTLCYAAALGAEQALTLHDAIARTLASNPGISADEHAIAAVDSRARLNALAPPLTIGGEFENAIGTGALSGVSGAEMTLRLSKVIELGGKRAARVALGATKIARQRNRAELHRIDLAAETTRRFIAVAARQAELAVATADLATATQMRESVARWHEAKRSPEADLAYADIGLTRAELGLDEAKHELEVAWVKLAAMWIAADARIETVSANLEQLPDIPEFATLAAQLDNTADQRAFAFEAETIEAKRRLAQTGERPDVAVSFGMRRLEALDDQALVLGISVPLGSAERAHLGAEGYGEELAVIQSRQKAARSEAEQRLFGLYQGLLHAHHVFETHRDKMLPKAQQALASTKRGYEMGRYNFLALNQAQQVLVELRRAALDAAASYHRRLVDIERLTAINGAGL